MCKKVTLYPSPLVPSPLVPSLFLTFLTFLSAAMERLLGVSVAERDATVGRGGLIDSLSTSTILALPFGLVPRDCSR